MSCCTLLGCRPLSFIHMSPAPFHPACLFASLPSTHTQFLASLCLAVLRSTSHTCPCLTSPCSAPCTCPRLSSLCFGCSAPRFIHMRHASLHFAWLCSAMIPSHASFVTSLSLLAIRSVSYTCALSHFILTGCALHSASDTCPVPHFTPHCLSQALRLIHAPCLISLCLASLRPAPDTCPTLHLIHVMCKLPIPRRHWRRCEVKRPHVAGSASRLLTVSAILSFGAPTRLMLSCSHGSAVHLPFSSLAVMPVFFGCRSSSTPSRSSKTPRNHSLPHSLPAPSPTSIIHHSTTSPHHVARTHRSALQHTSARLPQSILHLVSLPLIVTFPLHTRSTCAHTSLSHQHTDRTSRISVHSPHRYPSVTATPISISVALVPFLLANRSLDFIHSHSIH